jgi:hypothetical protein
VFWGKRGCVPVNFFSEEREPVRAAALMAADPLTVVCRVEPVLKPIFVTVSQSLSPIVRKCPSTKIVWMVCSLNRFLSHRSPGKEISRPDESELTQPAFVIGCAFDEGTGCRGRLPLRVKVLKFNALSEQADLSFREDGSSSSSPAPRPFPAQKAP